VTLADAHRLRWLVVALCVSAVFGLGPLAGDTYYWLTGDDVNDEWVYIASVSVHFLAVWWIAGWPVLRFMLTGRES
jgi:hypothetical protein